MAISIKSLKRVCANSAARVLIYGPAGIGKTTLASEFPDPVFLQVAWAKIVDHADKNGANVPLNEYFAAHPENMLGDFGAFGSMYRADDAALVARLDQDTAKLLADAIKRLPENVIEGARAEVKPEPIPVVQSSRAFHTGANAIERIIARPRFDGPVERGGRYVLVDDVSVMGGTLAELAHHIRANGGEVVGSVLLVNAARSGKMMAEKARIRAVERRFGDAIRQELGVEPSALTGPEAGYLLNFRDIDALRNRIAAAKGERSERLRAQGVQKEDRSNGVKPRFSIAETEV
ncbi:MAG: AAA family ATPase [Rhodoblastus sp.]